MIDDQGTCTLQPGRPFRRCRFKDALNNAKMILVNISYRAADIAEMQSPVQEYIGKSSRTAPCSAARINHAAHLHALNPC